MLFSKFSRSFLRSTVFLITALLLSCIILTAQDASNSDKPSPSAAQTQSGSPVQSPDPGYPVIQKPVEERPQPSLPPLIDPKTLTPVYETIQEDWSNLQIGTSKLEPEKPLAGSSEEKDAFTRELVQVKWRPGDPLDLWVILPKGVKKPPVVLYLYDYMFDSDRFRDDGWATRVTSDGVAAVGFVSALSGHRFHDRPLKQWFVSELQESIGSTVHDVKFILDYLAQRKDVDMDRVGIFGQGSGGTIAILSAAADSRIKAVDALEPWGDWPDFLAKSTVVQGDPDKALYVKPDFLKKVAPLDPVKWLPEIKVPVRIQQVHQDETTPMESKEALKAAAPKQAEVVRFEAASDLGMREGRGRLFYWVKTKVKESGPGSVTAAAVTPETKAQPASSSQPQ